MHSYVGVDVCSCLDNHLYVKKRVQTCVLNE